MWDGAAFHRPRTPLPTSPLKGGGEKTWPRGSREIGGRRPATGHSPLPPSRGKESESQGAERLANITIAGQGRTPPPFLSSHLEGGRSQGVRAEDTAPTSLSPGRTRAAAVSLLPPFRGEVGRGVDPLPTDRDAGQRRAPPPTPPLSPERGQERNREGARTTPPRRPPPDLPPERGEEPGRRIPRRHRRRRAEGAPTPCLLSSPLEGGRREDLAARFPRDRRSVTGHRPLTPPPSRGKESESQGAGRLANIAIAGQDAHRRRFSPPTWKGGGREGGRSAAHRPRRRTKARPAANSSPLP